MSLQSDYRPTWERESLASVRRIKRRQRWQGRLRRAAPVALAVLLFVMVATLLYAAMVTT